MTTEENGQDPLAITTPTEYEKITGSTVEPVISESILKDLDESGQKLPEIRGKNGRLIPREARARRAQIWELAKQGLSTREIAERVGISARQVSTLLVRDKVRIGPNSKPGVAARRAEMRDLAEQGLSNAEIAERLGTRTDRISRLLAKAGIRIPKAAQSAVKERRLQIIKLASEGRSSKRIAEIVGLSNETVRNFLFKEGLSFSADIGVAGTRRRFDPNRIVSQIIDDMEGMKTHLELVNIWDLDPAQVTDLSSRFYTAVESLGAFSRRLKNAKPPVQSKSERNQTKNERPL